MEAAGKTPVTSLKGGASRRRTRRYLRHLDKLIEQEGSAYDKVATLLAEEYGDELAQELAKAKEFHQGQDQAEAWDEEHEYGHLISKVYELLQRVWGDLNAEQETGQGRRRDRRSERRQRRQENRGRRRLNRQ